VEFDVDQEDNFGRAGRVARKRKDAKQKGRKHLSGNAAKELYLECLQLILRKQLAWLINEKDLPLELEVVVRDLWDLRVRNFAGLTPARGRSKGGGSVKSEPLSSSDGEIALFSSQSEPEPSSDDSTATLYTKAKRWMTDEGDLRAMPTLIDTLALTYLGCVTVRQPVRIGDLYRWAKRNKLPYRGAVRGPPVGVRPPRHTYKCRRSMKSQARCARDCPRPIKELSGQGMSSSGAASYTGLP